jgi:uncharacterized membrane protein
LFTKAFEYFASVLVIKVISITVYISLFWFLSDYLISILNEAISNFTSELSIFVISFLYKLGFFEYIKIIIFYYLLGFGFGVILKYSSPSSFK